MHDDDADLHEDGEDDDGAVEHVPAVLEVRLWREEEAVRDDLEQHLADEDAGEPVKPPTATAHSAQFIKSRFKVFFVHVRIQYLFKLPSSY